MPTEISQVFEEARRLLGSRLWDTREGVVIGHVDLSVVVSPSLLTDGVFSVSFVTRKAGIRPWGEVWATVEGRTEVSSLNSLGTAVFFTLPAGLARIELV